MKILGENFYPSMSIRVECDWPISEKVAIDKLSQLCFHMEVSGIMNVKFFFTNTLNYRRALNTVHTWERLFKPEEA